MDIIEYAIYLGLYYLMAVFFMLPYGILVIGVVLLLKYLGADEGSAVLQILSILLILPWLFLPSYIAHIATRNRVQLMMSFYDAYGSAWSEVKAELSTLPLIGGWFSGRSRDSNSMG